jgi:hypothetical protein
MVSLLPLLSIIYRQTPIPDLKVLCQIIYLLNLMQLPLMIKLEILEQPIPKPKHPPMHHRKLIFRPTLLHRGCLDNIPALLMHIQLHQPIILLLFILNFVELVLVQAVHVSDISQPGIEQAHVLWRHGGFDAAAAVMAADDNVLYFEVADGVVYDGHDVEVDVVYEVGNVAVDKHLAGFEACDGFGGDAGVGAACHSTISIASVLWMVCAGVV